jgi:uncharacterized membrane protein
MPKPMIRILDLETQEVIDRQMTDEEYAAYQAQKITDDLAAEKEAEKANEKIVAASKLAALGLTANDLKALGLA